jgi:hypothetical protein
MTDLTTTRARMILRIRPTMPATDKPIASNLVEQLANYGREKDEGARERLRGFIDQSILKLSQQ